VTRKPRTGVPIAEPTARKRLLEAADRLRQLAQAPLDDEAADAAVAATVSEVWLGRLERLLDQSPQPRRPGIKPSRVVEERGKRWAREMRQARALHKVDPSAPGPEATARRLTEEESRRSTGRNAQQFSTSDVYNAEREWQEQVIAEELLRRLDARDERGS
jgi:hypothetical protein